MDRVDAFIDSDKGKMFGFTERPDFFETITILFLIRYDPEIARGIRALHLSEDVIKEICNGRDSLVKFLEPAGVDRKRERS